LKTFAEPIVHRIGDRLDKWFKPQNDLVGQGYFPQVLECAESHCGHSSRRVRRIENCKRFRTVSQSLLGSTNLDRMSAIPHAFRLPERPPCVPDSPSCSRSSSLPSRSYSPSVIPSTLRKADPSPTRSA